MNTEYALIPPLQSIFDAAKRFGLTDDEVWQTVNASVASAGQDATVGQCLEELSAALARRILAKERRAAR